MILNRRVQPSDQNITARIYINTICDRLGVSGRKGLEAVNILQSAGITADSVPDAKALAAAAVYYATGKKYDEKQLAESADCDKKAINYYIEEFSESPRLLGII